MQDPKSWSQQTTTQRRNAPQLQRTTNIFVGRAFSWDWVSGSRCSAPGKKLAWARPASRGCSTSTTKASPDWATRACFRVQDP